MNLITLMDKWRMRAIGYDTSIVLEMRKNRTWLLFSIMEKYIIAPLKRFNQGMSYLCGMGTSMLKILGFQPVLIVSNLGHTCIHVM